MIFATGDIHGVPWQVYKFAKKHKLTYDDVIIIPGDVGANFYGGEKDEEMKRNITKHPVTLLCVHGNHEMRPWEAEGYHLQAWNGGYVFVNDKYPHMLFAKDGEIYTIDGIRFMAIGGAYSVDKWWRLRLGNSWWQSEQPTEEIKAFVEAQLASNEVDVFLSHTCPRKYEPVEVFLPHIDQSQVDKSTEDWLDTIEDRYPYKAWFCGHWHVDKRIDKMHFMYRGWELIEKEMLNAH